MLALALAGCGTVRSAEEAVGLAGPSASDAQLASRYLGSIAADDTEAVDLARRVLLGGGTAADAATEIALALTVTQPGRAGLDGGGVCLVKPATGAVVELDFPAQNAGGTVPVPGLVRGLAALQERYGVLRWQQIVAPVEALAVTGMRVTPGLLADLQTAGLGAGGPSGRPLEVGDILPQRGVAATLSQLRTGGVAAFYTGAQGGALVAAGVPARALADYAPVWRRPASLNAGGAVLFYPQGPAGAAIQAAWNAAGTGDRFAAARGAAFPPGAAIDQPAGSIGFLVADAAGRAVSCAIGLGRPFGSGQLVEPLGIFVSAPTEGAATSLAPIIGTEAGGDQLLVAVVGAGSDAAPADAAAIAWSVLRGNRPVAEAVSDPRTPAESVGTLVADRVSALSCAGGLPQHPGSCSIQHDPRGGGYSMPVDRLVK
ncbi:MAG: gamma-glutamyltranspeptidase / glutathione hydrolase [Aliidongia sp.]|nr:gamma-glutamyltranspeptidase / glutathione hydrolase [Aliidongia sp.]